VQEEELQAIWKNVEYLIIDEVSMVSATLLAQISHRLNVAKGYASSRTDVMFGGVNMIFCGDLGQLKPVKASPVYSFNLVEQISVNSSQSTGGQLAVYGAYLWRQIDRVIELKKNMRQSGDTHYAALLNRIRLGLAFDGVNCRSSDDDYYDGSDYEVINSRCLRTLAECDDDDMMERFKDAPILVGEKMVRDAINWEKTRQFASHTKQVIQLYHSSDYHKRNILEEAHRQRAWKINSSKSNDSLGILERMRNRPKH
jgi:ATP-dependent DNA helicase PIF1